MEVGNKLNPQRSYRKGFALKDLRQHIIKTNNPSTIISFGDIVYFEPANIQYKKLVNGVIDQLKVSLVDRDGNEILSNFKISIVLHIV